MGRIHLFLIIGVVYFLSSAVTFAADDVYQSPEAFVEESFGQQNPEVRTLLIEEPLQQKIQKIMGSHYTLSDVRYWEKDGRTAWILEDIGKFQPITTGFVVSQNGTLERVKVLIYRESHGWEVKHTFFTRQFKGAGLKREKKLDKRIDGISGATLSVNTLKRLGTLALLLHERVVKKS